LQTQKVAPAMAAAGGRQCRPSGSEDGSGRIDRFHLKGAPALQKEPLMPRPPELLVQVHASTFASWQEVGRFYWGLMRDKLDVDDDVRARWRRSWSAGHQRPGQGSQSEEAVRSARPTSHGARRRFGRRRGHAATARQRSTEVFVGLATQVL
jgi:hypothetical protein